MVQQVFRKKVQNLTVSSTEDSVDKKKTVKFFVATYYYSRKHKNEIEIWTVNDRFSAFDNCVIDSPLQNFVLYKQN